jgi:nitroimidazol reductase NimA-like FMN-containing flavoprotein (pyridoxamine 5'-phosphate oxidase superfamily)
MLRIVYKGFIVSVCYALGRKPLARKMRVCSQTVFCHALRQPWQEEQDRRSSFEDSYAILLQERNSTRSVTRRPALQSHGTPDQKEVFCVHEPVTQLDTRYSLPGEVATSWEETRRALETAEIFWLSTVRTDGRPHVTPLVAVWHDDALHFNSSNTSQKVVNLRGNPHVILTTGCNQTEGLDVVVEGDAVQVTDDDVLGRLAQAWATKWDGGWKFLVRDGSFYIYDQQGVLSDAIFVFSVKPTKVFAFARRTGPSHTRHQF